MQAGGQSLPQRPEVAKGQAEGGKGQPRPAKKSGPSKSDEVASNALSSASAAAATASAPPLGASVASSSSTGGRKNKKKKEGPEKSRPGETRGAGEEPVGKAKLRVVVRRLPPNVPEAVFWKAVSPWVTRARSTAGDEEGGGIGVVEDGQANVDHAYFVQGKLKDGSRRGVSIESGVSPHVFSRAYLRFKSIVALVEFHRAFDGHLFKDGKGNEYFAVVEFAPYQRTPGDLSRRRKTDPRQGTIEDDSDYKAFLATLEHKRADEDGGQTQSEKTDAQLMSQVAQTSTTSNAERAKHTPLLDHLRAQRIAKAESSALKNARSYLNRSNNAYAAASKAKSAAGAEKGTGKAKQGKETGIPTGPKASRRAAEKGEKGEKGAKRPQQKANGGSAPLPTGPSAGTGQKAGKAARGQGTKGQGKGGGQSASPAGPNPSLLTNEERGSSARQAAGVAGSAERRGAPRGRGWGTRGGRGRGGGVGGAAQGGSRTDEVVQATGKA